MRKPCQLLAVSRSSGGYQPAPEREADRRIKRLLDEICLADACLGSHRLVTVLARDHGLKVNRKRLRQLRREMAHEAIGCRPWTSLPEDGHRGYPDLLRHLQIDRPNQVWCADIT